MVNPPKHGGRLQAAAETFGIPSQDWLDLSTGINPFPWPTPPIPTTVWQRLPESHHALEQAAQSFYGQPMLAVPGSQWAIQELPKLFSKRRVWLPLYCYEEYGYCWQRQDHQLARYQSLPVSKDLTQDDVIIVVNPNNPTAELVRPDELLELAHRLLRVDGTLVVDEAFMDCWPEFSLLQTEIPANVVILRSVGKFYGMAGLRLGFIRAPKEIHQQLAAVLGPWAISHPAVYLGEKLLLDRDWHQANRIQLKAASLALSETLQNLFIADEIRHCGLFASVQLTPHQATAAYNHCAREGVLIRCFPHWGILRFGLCGHSDLQRLADSLDRYKKP